MCGSLYSLRGRISFLRLTLPDDVAQPLIDRLIEEYKRNPPERRNLPWPPPNYYVRPTQHVSALVGNEEGDIEPRNFKWGHAPKRYQGKMPLFNARGETLDEKATWCEPWHNQRCLILAGGFFEWVNKKPHAVRNADRPGMLLAGLWREDDGVKWCSVVTCEPSKTFREYHHREPVIIRGDDWKRWLFDKEPPEDLIRPSPDGLLDVFPCEKPESKRAPEASSSSSQHELF